MRRMMAFCVIVLLAVVAAHEIVYAQAWKPTRPITVVVPWPAGGASDTTGRMIAGQME